MGGFQVQKNRRTLHNNEWWFVINDVIESLTDSNDPAQYFKRLRQRHEELTDEWKRREVSEKREYEILTAEIAKAAFGITPGQHKNLKGLRRENLRDHMTDLELIFSMLGEAATTEITRVDDAKGFRKNKHAAREGGEVAGKARKDLEKKTGKKVVSPENYLAEPESRKKLERK